MLIIHCKHSALFPSRQLPQILSVAHLGNVQSDLHIKMHLLSDSLLVPECWHSAVLVQCDHNMRMLEMSCNNSWEATMAATAKIL